jgi:hypothetical protein
MLLIQSLLVLSLVVLTGGYFVLVTITLLFRRSFKVPTAPPLLLLSPLLGMLGLLLGLLFPNHRILLHLGAASAAALAGWCVWQIVYEAGTLFYVGLFYLAAWVVYYGLVLWGGFR